MSNDNILQAENAIIGAALETPELWHAILGELSESDLVNNAARQIMHAARMIAADGDVPDATTIADCVACAGIDRKLLMDYMRIACVPSALHQNIAIVKRSTNLRTLFQLGDSITKRARQGDEPNAIIGDAAKQLDDLVRNGHCELLDSTHASIAFYDFRAAGRTLFVPTGLPTIDETLGGGMLNSGLYIMAARPGCGKTALALQIADTVAAHTGAVLFVTLEMDSVQLTARRIARITGIPANRLLMHTLAAEEEVAVALAHKQLAHEPLYMNGREHCSINDIRVLAHQVKDLRLVVIDYLGLLKPTRHYNSRYEEVTAISGELKALARSLGVPVLCLAQLNRANEMRPDKRPCLADLRDSGAIEQDADGVFLLHREDMHRLKLAGEERLVEVECTLAKHRHGATGAVNLGFDLQTGDFQEIRGVANVS